MATTWMKPMHVNKGKTIAQCLKTRTNYAKNSEKTAEGELISSFNCAAETVDKQFLLSKKIYWKKTGRKQKNDVIAYHVRQSFSPEDKITPEVANEIGYKLAEKFTHGNNAFIVATHIDKAHIHNHIIFNSTNLTCDKKFRNFWGSSKAIRNISDTLSLEYGLSIVKNPKSKGNHYGEWLDEKGKPTITHSDILRNNIYEVVQEKPKNFEDFLKKLRDRGYTVKRGKHIAVRSPDMKKNIRLRSLGEDYSEENLRKIIGGTGELPKPKGIKPTKTLQVKEDTSVNLLIDIDKALQEKGIGYQKWAKKFNLKQMAKTVNYLTEHDMMDYSKLKERANGVPEKLDSLLADIKVKEKRLAEVKVLQENIINYAKTKEIYKGYHQSGYSKKYKEEHISDIILHETAKKFFKENGYYPFPKMADLRQEYAETKAEKNKLYSEYKALRDENKDILNAKANLEVLLDIQKEEEKDINERKARS